MRTLNPDVDVILALFGLPSILVGFGEGVYNAGSVSMLQGSSVGVRNQRRPEKMASEGSRTKSLKIFDGHKLVCLG